MDIPKFVVDLSQPPEQRYVHLVPHFQEQIETCDLTGIFEELLHDVAGHKAGKCLALAARLALRRVHAKDESRELAGISKATSIPMHVLVAFNVLLDLLLGCTSGGVRTVEPRTAASQQAPRMLHFRTLDWGMERLRNIIVELDFVRSQGGPVIATTVTYFGYVGVLTGVTKGLSMSLNFRPYHSRASTWQRLSFRWHQAMVVLGFRQSISSMLREILINSGKHQATPQNEKSKDGNIDLEAILSNLANSPSTAAYLIFCRPDRVFVIEKDHYQASIRDSDTFLTAYNHDVSDEADPERLQEAAAELAETEDAIGMSDIVSLSLDRKACLDELWQKQARACSRRLSLKTDAVTYNDVMRFIENQKISNDETHYAVIMDPEAGKVIWRTAYPVNRIPQIPNSIGIVYHGQGENEICGLHQT